jgi:hypothetical protein
MYPPSTDENPDVARFPGTTGVLPALGRRIVTF